MSSNKGKNNIPEGSTTDNNENTLSEQDMRDMFSFDPDEPAPSPAQNTRPPEKQLTDEQSEALSKFDEDLKKAAAKRLAENKRREKQQLEEKLRQQENLKKAQEAQEKEKRRQQRIAEVARQKQLMEMEAPKVQKVTEVTKERDPMLTANIIKGITVLVVIAGIAYAGGLAYTKNLNETFIASLEKELMGIALAGTTSDNDIIFTDTRLTIAEMEENGLLKFLPDTDKDGLSDYYELKVCGTDPKNPDSDGDGISDGAEVYTGTNPLTPDDSSAPVTNIITGEGARAVIVGKAQNAFATIDKITNNSIIGAAGVVGVPCEFYTASSMESCHITLEYKAEDLKKWNSDPQKLALFKFNNQTLAFDRIESSVSDPNSHSVSADIDSIGIYAIGDSEYMQEEYNTRIFFLIDDSGSMYPEELCPNSEENDVEFKRLDFASNLIDRLGDTAQYGAAKFTGTYTKLADITTDTASVKSTIDSIRTSDTYFNGTEIADSINNALDELGKNKSDKNYIVLLTDGYPTNMDPEKEKAALQRAVDNNVTIFTIGLGKRIDADYLSEIAEATNGQFFQVSNASALDSICSKIESFMAYNKTTISLEEETDVYILADTGFNVSKDCMAYPNFRTDFSISGTDYGIAELTRQYYTGELALSAEGYTTYGGDEIPGYNLYDVAQLVDGKPDLVDLKIGFLDTYGEYLALDNKWNYKTSHKDTLRYTPDTMNFINEHNMTTITQPYTVKLPELEKWIEMLQNITFQKLPEFTSYECAIINSVIQKGTDKDLIDAFNYMQNIHLNTAKTDVYDFGFHGDEAFGVLLDELTHGNPVVVAIDGAALNAVRLLRESENTNKLVLEAYDCNNPNTTTYISLLRSPIYDDNPTPYYQYSATINGKDVSLKMYVTK